MSEFGPSGQDDDNPNDDPRGEGLNPFAGLPMFADLARLLQGQGTMSWDTARQLAMALATEGKPEPNVDPLDRIRLEQLARAAELHVADATGLSAGALQVLPVTRAQWVQRTLPAYQPLFEKLTAALGRRPAGGEIDEQDPMSAMFANVMQLMGPMMLGMTTGSMLGHLAQRALGQYDLPIPRPASGELMLVAPNVDHFGEQWSLPRDDLWMWVCLHEITMHAVLSVGHVRARLEELLAAYVGGFRPDATVLEDKLAAFDPSSMANLAGLQSLLNDPELILGAIQSPEQRAMLPQLHALVAVLMGYVDHTMDRVGERLIGSYGQLTEALHRRRVEASQSDRFVERLLGLELSQAQYDRGERFVAGVIERAGAAGLDRLWLEARTLPTPAEVDAPGLWLARIDLTDEP
ncbi:MAG: zinc-dependent metalloprotease [Acidimicrobiales bacterium]